MQLHSMRQASHTFLPHLCLTGHIFMCLKSTGLRSQSSAHQYNALMGAVLWPTSEWDRPLPGKDYNRRLLRSAGGASAYTGATSPRTGAGKQGDGSASNRLHRRSPTRASPQATASELPIYEEASLPVLAQDNMQPSLSSNPATPKKLSVMYVGMARGELGILTKRLLLAERPATAPAAQRRQVPEWKPAYTMAALSVSPSGLAPSLQSIVDDATGRVRTPHSAFASHGLHSTSPPKPSARLGRWMSAPPPLAQPASHDMTTTWRPTRLQAGGFPGWRLSSLPSPVVGPRTAEDTGRAGCRRLDPVQQAEVALGLPGPPDLRPASEGGDGSGGGHRLHTTRHGGGLAFMHNWQHSGHGDTYGSVHITHDKTEDANEAQQGPSAHDRALAYAREHEGHHLHNHSHGHGHGHHHHHHRHKHGHSSSSGHGSLSTAEQENALELLCAIEEDLAAKKAAEEDRAGDEEAGDELGDGMRSMDINMDILMYGEDLVVRDKETLHVHTDSLHHAGSLHQAGSLRLDGRTSSGLPEPLDRAPSLQHAGSLTAATQETLEPQEAEVQAGS